MDKLLWVGLGGAIGAMLRYSLSLLPVKGYFPIMTLVTNVLGAVLIGIVVGLFEKQSFSSSINLFLKTGVCGGFTTFSTFSLETLMLMESGKIDMGISYALLSVGGCVIGVVLGRFMGLKMNL